MLELNYKYIIWCFHIGLVHEPTQLTPIEDSILSESLRNFIPSTSSPPPTFGATEQEELCLTLQHSLKDTNFERGGVGFYGPLSKVSPVPVEHLDLDLHMEFFRHMFLMMSNQSMSTIKQIKKVFMVLDIITPRFPEVDKRLLKMNMVEPIKGSCPALGFQHWKTWAIGSSMMYNEYDTYLYQQQSIFNHIDMSRPLMHHLTNTLWRSLEKAC